MCVAFSGFCSLPSPLFAFHCVSVIRVPVISSNILVGEEIGYCQSLELADKGYFQPFEHSWNDC